MVALGVWIVVMGLSRSDLLVAVVGTVAMFLAIAHHVSVRALEARREELVALAEGLSLASGDLSEATP